MVVGWYWLWLSRFKMSIANPSTVLRPHEYSHVVLFSFSPKFLYQGDLWVPVCRFYVQGFWCSVDSIVVLLWMVIMHDAHDATMQTGCARVCIFVFFQWLVGLFGCLIYIIHVVQS
jgi:hypothetical protein